MEQMTLFDYNTLPVEMRTTVEQKTVEIKALVKRTQESVIEIGRRLIEVKALLPHGQFTQWLYREFSWNPRTAQRMMNVAQRFKNDNLSDLEIETSALYLLSAPSTPEEARHEALERASQGEHITHKTAQALVSDTELDNLLKEPIDIPDLSFDAEELAFLEKYIGEASEENGRTCTHSPTEYVKHHFLFLPEERDIVLRVLNQIKQAHGLETHSQALLWLCNQWEESL